MTDRTWLTAAEGKWSEPDETDAAFARLVAMQSGGAL